MLTNGLDGQMTMQSRSRIAKGLQHAWCRGGLFTARKAETGNFGRAFVTHKIMLKRQRAARRVNDGAHWIIAHRQNARANIQRRK